ncbi:MAG: hypothetical protein HOV82_10150 [Streptomyces sp.]|nr:hypothetical protein [Streptomyces sp.]
MIIRIPLDHLTSDALDALYERLDRAEQETTATATAAAHLTSLVLNRAERAEARLYHLQVSSEAAGILLTRTTDERDRLRAAIARVRALHHDWEADPGHCAHCQDGMGTPLPWPCPTVRALAEPAPGTTATQATDGPCICTDEAWPPHCPCHTRETPRA